MHYDGKRDKQRRKMVEAGEYRDLRPLDFRGYAKQGLTYAAKVDLPFTVETIEGIMDGNAGDYLAIGVNGEMYPIAADVFEATYRVANGVVPDTITTADVKQREAGEVTTAADIQSGATVVTS